MITEVEIAGELFEVECSIKITARSYPGRGADFNSPGEPPEACEFEVEIIALRELDKEKMPDLELPDWLRNTLIEHLQQSDAVHREADEIDRDPDYGRDPDAERDAMMDRD